MNSSERFATDDKHRSMVLTADGCTNRLTDNTPFRDNELAINASCEFHRGNKDEAEERMMMNYLSILTSLGKQPSSRQTIESFIIENLDLISASD